MFTYVCSAAYGGRNVSRLKSSSAVWQTSVCWRSTVILQFTPKAIFDDLAAFAPTSSSC